MEMLQFPTALSTDDADARVDARVDVDHDLDALQQRVGQLWMVEPRGGPATRGRLLTELQRLEFEIERLNLLGVAGEYVPQSAATSCATRYYALRRRWAGDDLAA